MFVHYYSFEGYYGEDKLDDGKIDMRGYIEMHGRQCDACGVGLS